LIVVDVAFVEVHVSFEAPLVAIDDGDAESVQDAVGTAGVYVMTMSPLPPAPLVASLAPLSTAPPPPPP